MNDITTPRYVCAVRSRPVYEPDERRRRAGLRESIALKMAAFMYPIEGRGRWNFRPIGEQSPPQMPRTQTERQEQRMSRKVRMARKRRRGWA